MDDTIRISRSQARVLLSGIAVASGVLAVARELITLEEFAGLVAIFTERVHAEDQAWLLDLAAQVERPSAPGTWH